MSSLTISITEIALRRSPSDGSAARTRIFGAPGLRLGEKRPGLARQRRELARRRSATRSSGAARPNSSAAKSSGTSLLPPRRSLAAASMRARAARSSSPGRSTIVLARSWAIQSAEN